MSEIRKYFVSRFNNGSIMEFDFSQLEVIALAHLSNDTQLNQDIIDGVDMHLVNASNMYGIPQSAVTDGQRKIAKRLSFQLQYGAGYKSMAKQNAVPEQLAKNFITAYYDRYPQVKDWQDNNITIVRTSRKLTDKRTPKGLPVGVSTIATHTGRRYTFKEKDSPPWMKSDTSFSPTEIKNYPVQGFATGDIVLMILGKVYRELHRYNKTVTDNILMVNTVHDSIVFDVAEDYQAACYDIVKPVMEDVPKYLKEDFGIDFDLPITVDCQIGKDWMTMESYDGT